MTGLAVFSGLSSPTDKPLVTDALPLMMAPILSMTLTMKSPILAA